MGLGCRSSACACRVLRYFPRRENRHRYAPRCLDNAGCERVLLLVLLLLLSWYYHCRYYLFCQVSHFSRSTWLPQRLALLVGRFVILFIASFSRRTQRRLGRCTRRVQSQSRGLSLALREVRFCRNLSKPSRYVPAKGRSRQKPRPRESCQ